MPGSIFHHDTQDLCCLSTGQTLSQGAGPAYICPLGLSPAPQQGPMPAPRPALSGGGSSANSLVLGPETAWDGLGWSRGQGCYARAARVAHLV